MGESVSQGTIVQWRKQAGDYISEGDPLVEVTTDKVDVEVPATISGVIRQILAAEGSTVAVGSVLAEIDTSAKPRNGAPQSAAGQAPVAAAAPQLVTVDMPEMGESVTQGTIVEWKRKVGDHVTMGDALVEITTDKVDVEVPATSAGVVTRILAAEGATVAVGAPLVELDTNAQAPLDSTQVNGHAAAPRTPTARTTVDKAAPPPAKARAGDIVATPRAKRLARKLGADLSAVRGSGPEGLILHEDVEQQADRARPRNGATVVELPPLSQEAKVTPLKGPVGMLATYMEQSLSVPTATSFRTLSVDVLDARRKELNAAIKAAGRSEKVSFTHLVAFALVRAAHEQPGITAHFRRDGDVAQRVEPGIHLGLAVDAQRKDGQRFLLVPVIKNADALDFAQFRSEYETLVSKTRDNKLSADELSGASFTLTNPGGIGTVASVPRLMAGQGAIIATGAIGFPSGFGSANDATLRSFGVQKVMTMTSTYDHRVIQGAQSGEYLRRVEELLAGKDGFYEMVFASLRLQAKATPQIEGEARAAKGGLAASASDEMLRAVASGMSIVSSYRTHGHLAATLDPLGAEPVGDPALDPRNYGLTPALQAAIPASVLRVKVPGDTLADVLPRLRETYSSTIAYEVEHISNTAQREWLRDRIESGKNRVKIPPARQIEVLQRLTRVETLERYMRKMFLGQKTFSIEGLDVMIPMLEEMLVMLGQDGINHAVIGMAHRGRLNTIAHVVNVPYEEILSEFEAANLRGEVPGDADVTGDVKYHHGADGEYETPSGAKISVHLANNPSHLEAVDPVVEGYTRAFQTDHSTPMATLDFKKAAPILIHGDAAFTAQGVVAEVFNLQALAGYATGGTLHVISNNQIGFTTDAKESRSTRYSSDLAKGFDVPIVHVNADDVDACTGAVHLAMEFRRQFGRDIIIDLIGYRRFGHNEQDEPSYTQPETYERIKTHPTARELFANKLVAQGLLSGEQVSEMVAQATARLQEAHKAVKGAPAGGTLGIKQSGYTGELPQVDTKIDRARLLAWSDELVTVPDDYQLNKKLSGQFERRKALIHDQGLVDWGMSEALAFASLLAEGTPVRLTGQDTERGTFSHRHAVLHDRRGVKQYVPLQHLNDARASFEIYNSPLSEYACLGFEYGYSGVVPNALVLWEAQFGDFNNGAQIIVDQFIASGHAKWSQNSRLTLLLPHGYEGAGPEHSSARLERFLQLTAEGNLRVANCSNAANYFHLLRLQARDRQAAPLVIMTPKSLLRAEVSYGSLDEMATGGFRPVVDDPRFAERKGDVERLILCSGKIYYDLIGHATYAGTTKTAIARVEMLSPLPYRELNALIATYSNLKKLIWVQEEPKNMGARAFVRRRLLERKTDAMDIEYIGRGYRASPSEGYPGAHAVEQERILTAALAE
ncbi:MAG: multifunctional oxoglutarate decarboxylase/oxoglutarate dehydrogenase thiamine pyrophosphate-binding subunit/dihydrolipoyllysine-residue succinyltransferase subunit [Candidatus Meridianibacter frigidus]|nr:MAG: multifunctional oxoglutarate decarboxylase/oxoglutarate dehydrogenase thiamine pyrophosphate-binding subunit/dihydrolipoyllysine-residue succinyltransferase subunit [Candidatus Eremiobacteraeota bacterium]